MSVETTYGENRRELKRKLEDCLDYATRNLMDKNTWGYEDMKEDYDLDIIMALRKLIKMV